MDQHHLFSAVTYIHTALSGREGLIVGCFYLEVECQSWLLDIIDRGLMKIDEVRRLTKNN